MMNTQETVPLQTALTLETICTLIPAFIAASQFPGITIRPHEDSTFNICHWHPATEKYNRYQVELAHLMAAVNDMVEELQESFGEHGEKLYEIPLHIELTADLT